MMKAGVVHGLKDIRFEDINKPEPNENQVLIKVNIYRNLWFRCSWS